MNLGRWQIYTPFLVRIGLGAVFVIGGAKLVFTGDWTALAAMYVDPAKGFISPFFAERITSFGIGIGTFLRWMGSVEILLGLSLIAGFLTSLSAVLMGLLLWTFPVASPVIPGEIRLSRDLALMGCCFGLAQMGGGKGSLDALFGIAPSFLEKQKDAISLTFRLSLAFTFITSSLFAGGPFDNVLNTFLPRPVLFLLGLLLAGGLFVRGVAGVTILWLAVVIVNALVAKGLLLGLDSIKRELGFIAVAGALLVLGGGRFRLGRKS